MESMSLLPMIKCSSCGVDIDIAQLADHVCADTAPTDHQAFSPQLDRAATFGGADTTNKQDGSPRTRMPPALKLDPYAANKPFQYPNSPLSPSPLSPAGRKSFQRSATSPLPRMDNLSPQFPTTQSQTSQDMQLPSTTYSPYGQESAQPNQFYAPLSPRTDGGENVSKRFDTIAPGPFDGRGDERRPSTSNGPQSPSSFPQPGHQRTDTQNSSRGFFSQRISLASTMSRGSAISNGSYGLPSRSKQGTTGAMLPPPPPPPVPPIQIEEKTEGIDAFLERLQNETMGTSRTNQQSRSASPVRQDNRSRSPMRPQDRSRSPMRLEDRSRSPMRLGGADGAKQESRPDGPRALSRRPPDIRTSESPPRLTSAKYSGPSHNSAISTSSNKELPPLPPMKDVPVDMVYTPSDSGRSEDSYASSGFRSVASSRSSPPTSEIGHSRQASKNSRLDQMEEPVPRTLSPDTFGDPRIGPSLFPDSRRARDDSNMSRGAEPLLKPPTTPQMPASPQSPLDPAIQKGLSYERRNEDLRSPRDPALSYGPEPPRIPKSQPQGATKRQPPGASKGRCRGCGEAILGKSVKDSSGRLSGRYHKECFVCRTCRAPFPSAEFYVFENSPYCHQHYHILNGSLCRTCNRGIEGQYLETDQRLKFHPRCFTCFTCRVVLRDDYYELGRRNFCERHAYAAMNQMSQRNNMLGAPNGQNRNLQKRRTRMMMMR